MTIHSRHAKWALAVALIVVAATSAHAQMRYARGQNVAPAFEGWERNPDGTINMVFGYLNRNYEEEVDIPIGPNNRVDLGGDDRGQPTHFYPRRQRFVFKVAGASRLGQEPQGAVDAHLPRAHRRGEGMAPAGMGAEPRGVLREQRRRRARRRQPASVHHRQHHADVHDGQSRHLDGFGHRRRASETAPSGRHRPPRRPARPAPRMPT